MIIPNTPCILVENHVSHNFLHSYIKTSIPVLEKQSVTAHNMVWVLLPLKISSFRIPLTFSNLIVFKNSHYHTYDCTVP